MKESKTEPKSEAQVTIMGGRPGLGKTSFESEPKPPREFGPWAPDEIPVGVIVRHADWEKGESMIIGRDEVGRVALCQGNVIWLVTRQELFEKWVWRTPNSVAWLICGVEAK